MNTYYVGTIPVSYDLYHHGILGQKWGIRRYQNPDGTLTAEGRKHYYGDKKAGLDDDFLQTAQQKRFNDATEKEFNAAYKRTAREDRKRKYGEGRPNEIESAYNTYARKAIQNMKMIKEAKQNLYKALKPELEFETNKKLWKQYGYDPENDSFKTIHDVWDSYGDAKEKYLSDKGLAYGSKLRNDYDRKRTEAFEDYNNEVQFAVRDMLGYYGNTPVSVTSKWGKKYYSVANEAISKSLRYGYYADTALNNGEGALDFYSLADDYERDKKHNIA